jgi:hypothetical protein
MPDARLGRTTTWLDQILQAELPGIRARLGDCVSRTGLRFSCTELVKGERTVRFIPTRIHGILDYLMGIVLIALPWVLGLNEGGLQTWLPVVLGAGVIVYSLLTDYELGVVKTIPMPVHLGLDIAGGLLLAVSPWLFRFADEARVPYVVLGLFEVVAALVTQTVPVGETGPGARRPF